MRKNFHLVQIVKNLELPQLGQFGLIFFLNEVFIEIRKTDITPACFVAFMKRLDKIASKRKKKCYG